MVLITVFIVVCGSIVEVDAITVDNIASKISPLIYGIQSGCTHKLPNFTLQWTTALVIILDKLVHEAMSHSEVCCASVVLPSPNQIHLTSTSVRPVQNTHMFDEVHTDPGTYGV